MICWHNWEEPLYNEALNLREGLKVCQKCASVKGFKRFVPIDYESLNLQEPQPSFDLKMFVSGTISLLIGVSVAVFVLPLLPEVTVVDNGPATALAGLIPIFLVMIPTVGGISNIILASRMLPTTTDPEASDEEAAV